MEIIHSPDSSFDRPDQQITFAASNLDLPPKDILFSGAHAYLNFMRLGVHCPSESDPQYDGFEWTPVRTPTAQHAGEDLARAGNVLGFQESFRETSIRDAVGSRSVEAVGVVVAFPLLDKSYWQLQQIQQAATDGAAGRRVHAQPEPLPLIVHPTGQGLGSLWPKRPRLQYPQGTFGPTLMQPTVEWAIARGVDTTASPADVAEQIIWAYSEQGVTGIALDLNHLQANRYGQEFGNNRAGQVQLAYELAKQAVLGEVQVSFQPGLGGQAQILAAACEGNLDKTIYADMLAAVKDTRNPGDDPLRVVVEVKAGDIHAYSPKLIPLHDAHATFITSIKDILAA